MRHRLAGLLLLGPCWGWAAAPADLAPLQAGLDYHSFANIEQFRVTRLELDLHVDMTNKELDGVAGLQVRRLDPGATELVLDTRDLTVLSVSEKAQGVLGATAESQTTWVNRPFHFEKKDPVLGSALVIELPPSAHASEFIKIEYETSPTAPALQWLTAAQTHHRPFLYTLSAPIGTRSWIPLQDTPQVRMTFKAIVHTSSDLIAVMSGRNDPKAKHNGEYAFESPQAIPSYLIALAVGDLVFKETGPRTGVYAQKPQIKAAALEFAHVEPMIAAGEKLFGPYRWGRFDILVMPPNFPAGGVANPQLSFISPTAIAGDGSGDSIVARALAHAWAGNLVTSATWRDLWLTEGLSAYLESRIVGAVVGARREAMDRVLGLDALRAQLAVLPPGDQGLAIDLRARDPADAYGEVRSEKGRLFFTTLEARFGRERFDAFLLGYFEHFAFKNLTTEAFLHYLEENLLDRYPGLFSREQVAAWTAAPGIPADAVLPVTDAFAAVDDARRSWLAGAEPAKKLNTHDWAAEHWIHFLDSLPPTLTRAQLDELDRSFGFTQSSNAEIARSWFAVVIHNQYQPAYVRLEQYLVSTGRRALIVPLYAELMKSPSGRVQAKRVFALARPGYHARTVAAVDPIVNPASDAESADDQ
jgi:aminopeptidase N